MIRANQYLFFDDFLKDMTLPLQRGVTVSRCCLEGDTSDGDIEFEVRVTRIGKDKLPRMTEAQVAKLDLSQPTTGATAP